MKHVSLALCIALAASVAEARQGCVGCTPLNDLGSGLYLGVYEGGLYSGGQNSPPLAHRTAALAAAGNIVPRNASGAPDENAGRIGMLSISMSNCNQEFSAFERRADGDDHRNARLDVVNGCQGGQALDGISNPAAAYWQNLAQRVGTAGLTPEQVQAVWIKMADAQPPTLDFPDHAQNEQANATAVLQILKATYPNLQIAFFSSRTYGGNTMNPARGEPLSFETGFAVKWLIEAQIAGDAALNHDPLSGPVVAPLVLWGPYLWANGTVPRSDGLVWLPEDFEGDGVHPAASGEQKVADMLEQFFQFDRFATPWYGRPTRTRLVTRAAIADAAVNPGSPTTNFGSQPVLAIGAGRDAYLAFDLSGLAGTVAHARLSLITPPTGGGAPGTELRGVSDTSWSEGAITFANAPPVDGTLHGDLPVLSRGTATSFEVTAVVQANLGGPISFALTSTPGLSDPKSFLSREGGEAPRLVLTMLPACVEPGVPFCRSLPNSTGAGCELVTHGSASLLANDLELHAHGLPPLEPGLFFYGLNSTQLPFGEGLRCIAAPTVRLNPPVFADLSGSALRPVDFAAPPLGSGQLPVTAGDTLHFQCWYRDPDGGPAGFNLSDGAQLTVCP